MMYAVAPVGYPDPGRCPQFSGRFFGGQRLNVAFLALAFVRAIVKKSQIEAKKRLGAAQGALYNREV